MNFKDTVLNIYNRWYRDDPSIVSCVENVIDRIPPKFMDIITSMIDLFALELHGGQSGLLFMSDKLILGRYDIRFLFNFHNSNGIATDFYATIKIIDTHSNTYLFNESSTDLDYLYEIFKRFIDEA